METQQIAEKMARATLHQARKEREEEEGVEKVCRRPERKPMETMCSRCGRKMLLRGSYYEWEEGKKKFICGNCRGRQKQEDIPKVEPPAVKEKQQLRRLCFFCNNDTFYLGVNGIVQCSSCLGSFVPGGSNAG